MTGPVRGGFSPSQSTPGSVRGSRGTRSSRLRARASGPRQEFRPVQTPASASAEQLGSLRDPDAAIARTAGSVLPMETLAVMRTDSAGSTSSLPADDQIRSGPSAEAISSPLMGRGTPISSALDLTTRGVSFGSASSGTPAVSSPSTPTVIGSALDAILALPSPALSSPLVPSSAAAEEPKRSPNLSELLAKIRPAFETCSIDLDHLIGEQRKKENIPMIRAWIAQTQTHLKPISEEVGKFLDECKEAADLDLNFIIHELKTPLFGLSGSLWYLAEMDDADFLKKLEELLPDMQSCRGQISELLV